jgi:flagellar biosynthesis protein FlhF
LKIRKFFAGSSREALRMVREALGPDAVVLSNRAVDGGVELVALAENDLASLAHPNEPVLARASAAQPPRGSAWNPSAPPYEGAPQPAPHQNRALPDPFASTFGAPAAIVEQQAYARHEAAAPRGQGDRGSPVRPGRDQEAYPDASSYHGQHPAQHPPLHSPQHPAPGAGAPARFGAQASPGLERVVERAVERSMRQPGAADAGAAARYQAPSLGEAEHVVRGDTPPLTPAVAVAKKMGTPGERIVPVSALPHAAPAAPLSAMPSPVPTGAPAAPAPTGAAVAPPSAAAAPTRQASPLAQPLPQGLPASAAAFAVPPVRPAASAASAADAALVASAPAACAHGSVAAAPAGADVPPAPRAAYSMRTTVSASLGMPFNLGAGAPAAAPAAAAPAAAPAIEPTPLAAPVPAAPAAVAADAAPAAPSGTAADAAGGASAVPAAVTVPAAPKRDLAAEIAAVPVDEAQMRVAEMVAQNVIGEIHSMRGLLEEQLASLVWSDRQRREPVRGQAAKSLLAAGFSAQLVKLLIERMPTQTDHAQAMEWLKAALERNLPVLQSEDALLERGGVYALMGPTGVGKTTTTAKLAARCVMRYGADRVALLTTDSYRIGAHEQLRIYGKILGVGVHAVKDAADLRLALSELRNKHMVLIDTIGMSQRDRTVSEQVAMLCGTGMPVQRLLLLNATSHGDTLNEVVHAYRNRQAEGHPDLAGCILTKLDEATNIGAVLDTVIRYRLPVHYVSTGQKVPENLYVARKEFLMKSAFCVSRENSPFVPAEEDLASVMAALPARSSAELSEVRFG